MAEIGLVLVGPKACRMRLELGDEVPVIRVRSEEILPLEEDLEAMVGYAADGTFHGADADRWRLLPDALLREETQVLWACAQVQAAGLHQATSGWDKVLVVGWIDEPGLVPATRSVVEGDRPITVLLGGQPGSGDPARLHASQTVLAHLVRQGQLTTVIMNPEPQEVLDVALDAARHPDPIRVPRAKPVDLGPLLDLPSTWCVPAAPVHFFALVHVPMGHARRLPHLAVLVAAHKALRDLLHGPPVDVEGIPVKRPELVRARLPDAEVAASIEARIKAALDEVRFEGDEPLVEQIDRRLRPVLAEVERIGLALADAERLRLQHLRLFGAAGIHYTVQSLSARLDGIHESYPVERLEALARLLEGEGTPNGETMLDASRVHLSAWRRAFAGLPSRIARPGSPGWQLARELVLERFSMFRAEFSAAVARNLDVLVRRALDPDAPPSTTELRSLKERAERVRDALDDVAAHLEEQILAEAEEALRNDRIVRWAAADAKALFRQLSTRIQALPLTADLDRRATAALSRRPLGMAEDRDFEHYLQDLTRDVHGLGASVEEPPTYESVLLLLLEGRDPPVLRQALAQSQGAEVELHLERPVEPALMNWLTATGMLVVVAPRLKTCAIYWQRVEQVGSDVGERLRRGTTEHRMSDLSLPAPTGDVVGGLVDLVRAAVYLVVGLALGVLGARRQEGQQVHEVYGRDLGLPELVLLPHGGLHFLAHDPETLARVRARVEERLGALPLRADAPETVRKLVELATLGPSSTLSAQLGLYGARFEHLEHPIHALLQRHANLAVAAMVDCLHTSELEQLVRPPRRRTLVDLLQLGPSGG